MPRINHNIPAMVTGTALRQADDAVASSLEKLSTGLRINRASDDAAGLSVSEQLTTQVNGIAMGNRNAQDGIAAVNIAEGALNEVEAMVQRMRELAVQASNDTLTSVDRSYIQVEVDELKNEVDRITNGTQYNGMMLLNGGAPWGTGASLHVGPNNDVVTGADVILVTIGSISTGSLGIAGTFAQMVDGTFAAAAINTLDVALTSINTLRADLGAKVNRLQHAINNLESQQTNMQAAESTIRDTDFAAETTEYTKNQILQQSSTAMLAQANQLPQTVLTLLK
jgi:flagellin